MRGSGRKQCANVQSEVAEVAALQKKHAEIWLQFTPSVAKELSTAAYHKEPTAATLRAQNQAPLTMALPIDKVRYVSFRDASGVMQKIEYPSMFRAGSYEQYLAELVEMEKRLEGMGAGSETGTGASSGAALAALLSDSAKVRSFIEWSKLSLEAKHQRILTEYLNAGIESFSGDSPSGYEAMYSWRMLAVERIEFSTNFSGEVAFVDSDEEYSVVSSGGGWGRAAELFRGNSPKD